MKTGLSIIVLAATLSLGFCDALASPASTEVPADSLVANIDKYHDTRVEVVGLVVHVCGVDGRKMKLTT